MKKILNVCLIISLVLASLFIPINIVEATDQKVANSNSTRGIYYIASKINNNKVVNVTFKENIDYYYNVNICNYNGGNNQKWEFEYNSKKNAYVIWNKWAGKVLSMDKDRNGTNVYIDTLSLFNDEQLWQLENVGDGYYKIKNFKYQNMVLDIYWGDTKDGTNIQVHEWNNGDNQKWKLTTEEYQPNISILNNRFGIETTNIGVDTSITDLRFYSDYNNGYKIARDRSQGIQVKTVKNPFYIIGYNTQNGFLTGQKFSKQIPAGISLGELDKLLEELPALKMGEAIQFIAAPSNVTGTPKIYVKGGVINNYDSFNPEHGMNNYESSRRVFRLTPSGLELDPMIMK